MRRMLCARLAVGVLVAVIGCLVLPRAVAQATKAPVRDPSRRIQPRPENWLSLRRKNVVMQQSDYSCGAAALATLIRYYWGDPITETDLLNTILSVLTFDQVKDRIENGLTMTDLRKAAVARGYLASMGRRTLAELTELRVPAVVRIEKNDYEHFVVFRGVLKDRVFIADPIRGNLRMSIQQFDLQWQDDVILVMAKPDTDLPKNAPLALKYHSPVQPELQPVRRLLMDPLRDPK